MQIIAHRGASGYEPENTLAAFKKAIDMGVDMIELDVYVLRTGELAVIHDRTVRRTTNGTGKVEQFSLAEIRSLDAGQGEKVPLLSEVLDIVNKKIPINIELKGRHTAKPLAELLTYYLQKEEWDAEQFLVSSFYHGEVRRFTKLLPEVPIGVLVDQRPFWLRPLTYHKNVHSIHFNARHLELNHIALAHRMGKKVFVYTVNGSTNARRMRVLNVDGIFTNYPDIMKPATATT